MKKSPQLALSVILLLATFRFSVQAQSDTIVISDSDLTDGNYTWNSNKLYILDGIVTLEGGQLSIEPGTQIIGCTTPTDTTQPTSALIITPEANILAIGTADLPIVFTTDDPNAYPTWQYIAWGGLQIKGNNNSKPSSLRYVNIAFAGKGLQGEEPGAALFLEEISDQSDIEYVEIYASKGDGIRIHGGEVDLAHTAVFAVDDDAYDWDFGWNGRGLYWFAYKVGKEIPLSPYPEPEDRTDFSHAIEGKGNMGPNGRISKPQIFNATFIGESCGNVFSLGSTFTGGAGILLKDNTGGTVANSLILDFADGGIQVEDLPNVFDCEQQVKNGRLILANNIWWNIGENGAFFLGNNLESSKMLNASEKGIISVGNNYEDPQALFLAEHLLENENRYQGIGIRTNRQWSECIALDPRPDQISEYDKLPGLPYPIDLFFQQRALNKNQKGAFESTAIWLDGWSFLAQNIVFGSDANPKYYYRGTLVEPYDTFRVDCPEMARFHDSIYYPFIPCFPTIELGAAVARRGNRRRRPRDIFAEDPAKPLQPTFEHNWTYSGFDYGCHTADTFFLTILVFDTIPPVIHPIPDSHGGITAFTEDCDDSWIDGVETDTTITETGLRIKYLFEARDSSGNRSTLCLERETGPDQATVYADLDGDGLGNPNYPIQCAIRDDGFILIPEGFVINANDCNDEDPNAGIPEMDRFTNELLCGISGDICLNAIPLGVDSLLKCHEFEVGVASASYANLLPESCPSFSNGYSDVWAKFAAPPSGAIFLRATYNDWYEAGGFSIELYRGNCGSLERVECMDERRVFFERTIQGLIPNETYYLRLQEVANLSSSRVNLCLIDLDNIPKNISCDQSTPLTLDEQGCLTGIYSNLAAPYQFDDRTSSCTPIWTRSLWFNFDMPAAAELKMSINNITANFQAFQIRTFSGSCDSLYLLGCHNEAYTDTARLTLSGIAPGTPIWFQAMVRGNAEIPFELKICNSDMITSTDQNHFYEPSISIYPNPSVDGTFHWSFASPEPGTLSVNLYSMQGRPIRSFFKEWVPGGLLKHEFDVGDLPNGIYYVRFQSTNGSFIRKIILANH